MFPQGQCDNGGVEGRVKTNLLNSPELVSSQIFFLSCHASEVKSVANMILQELLSYLGVPVDDQSLHEITKK